MKLKWEWGEGGVGVGVGCVFTAHADFLQMFPTIGKQRLLIALIMFSS
jgi:hypothetical protein